MKRHYWIELDDVVATGITNFDGDITFAGLPIEGLAQAIKDQRKVAPHFVIPPVVVGPIERMGLLAADATGRWDNQSDPLSRVFSRIARRMAVAPSPPYTPKKGDWVLWRNPSDGAIWSGPGEVVFADDLRVVVARSLGGNVLLSTDRLEFALDHSNEVES